MGKELSFKKRRPEDAWGQNSLVNSLNRMDFGGPVLTRADFKFCPASRRAFPLPDPSASQNG